MNVKQKYRIAYACILSENAFSEIWFIEKFQIKSKLPKLLNIYLVAFLNFFIVKKKIKITIFGKGSRVSKNIWSSKRVHRVRIV